MNKKQKKVFTRIIVAAVLMVVLSLLPIDGWLKFVLFMIPYLVIGHDILLKAWKGILNRQVFDENFLMAVATIGAILLGDYKEGVAVMLFYQIGELFQSYAVGKSRRNISELMDIRPDYANIEKEDGTLGIDFGTDAFGQVSAWLGNFTVFVKALSYILTLGDEGLAKVGPLATLNANYIMNSLSDLYLQPIPGPCKHEFVFDGLRDKSTGVTTLNIAKALLDEGFHAPTIYFPLLFHESLMIEPTETETVETLDRFIAAMRKIAETAVSDPDRIKNAPYSTPISHPDEDEAALNPVLTYAELCRKQTL